MKKIFLALSLVGIMGAAIASNTCGGDDKDKKKSCCSGKKEKKCCAKSDKKSCSKDMKTETNEAKPAEEKK